MLHGQIDPIAANPELRHDLDAEPLLKSVTDLSFERIERDTGRVALYCPRVARVIIVASRHAASNIAVRSSATITT